VVAARRRSVFDWSFWSARALLAMITVSSTRDTIANDGAVTLREAITAANANAASGAAPAGDAGPDTIVFDIPGTGPRGGPDDVLSGRRSRERLSGKLHHPDGPIRS
jgi:hypothetical protein